MSVGLTEQKRNRSEQNMQSRRWRLTQRRLREFRTRNL